MQLERIGGKGEVTHIQSHQQNKSPTQNRLRTSEFVAKTTSPFSIWWFLYTRHLISQHTEPQNLTKGISIHKSVLMRQVIEELLALPTQMNSSRVAGLSTYPISQSEDPILTSSQYTPKRSLYKFCILLQCGQLYCDIQTAIPNSYPTHILFFEEHTHFTKQTIQVHTYIHVHMHLHTC